MIGEKNQKQKENYFEKTKEVCEEINILLNKLEKEKQRKRKTNKK